MSEEKYYFYSYYTFVGRISFAKIAGEPREKSVNGGIRQRIKDKVEITKEQYDNVDLVTLKKIFFPDEVSHNG